MKTIYKSEMRKLLETNSLREVGIIYGVTYERIRQICVKLGLNRRKWQKVKVVDDEIVNKKELDDEIIIKGIIECKKRGDKKRENELWEELLNEKK